jgi:glycosyltransferase involved in cell wall biosynthesis
MSASRRRAGSRRLSPSVLISLFSLGANAGGSRATLELSSRLASDVTYLVADPADGLASPLLANPAGHTPPTIRVNRVRPKPHVRPGTATARELVRRNLDLAADFAWVRRQDRLAATSGVELVCSMTTLMHRADVFWVHFLRAQAVEQTYGVSVSRADALLRRIDLKERHLLHLERKNLDPANHRLVIAPSQRTAADLAFHYDLDPARVAVVHNGVDDAVFTPPTTAVRTKARARLGLASDDVLALFVGRSPERKGLAPLVESAARVRRTAQGHRLRLAFAGFADTDYAHRVLAGSALGAFVPGELPQDVLHRDWYSAADLLILPSMVEPFGLVALEAMACGVPAAVSDVAGAAEVISDRETGVVLDSRHLAEELDRVLVDALESRLDLAAMGAAARCDVATRLSWASQATHLQLRLDALAAEGPSLVASDGRSHAPSRRPGPVVLRPKPAQTRTGAAARTGMLVVGPGRRPGTIAQASATRSR